MPPMNMHFLKNGARAASRSIKQVRTLEAVILFGNPAQRMKAVGNVLKSAAVLVQHESTAHLVGAVVDMSDNTIRAELLFALRGKLPDLARMRSGSNVLMNMLDKLPKRQQGEIAQELLPELLDLARHKVGSHVVRKLLDLPACHETVVPVIAENLSMLLANEVGQFVAARFMDTCPESVVGALTDAAVAQAFESLDESSGLVSLFRSARVPDAIKDSLAARVVEAAPTLCAAGRHNLLVAAVLELHEASRAGLIAAITPLLATMVISKGQTTVATALARLVPQDVIPALVASHATAAEVASHPYASMVLRSIIDTSIGALPKVFVAQLVKAALELAVVPAASPVVQRLITYGGEATAAAIWKQIDKAGTLLDLCRHVNASHVVQALVDAGESEARLRIVTKVLEDWEGLAQDGPGTHVAQKAVAFADDAALAALSTRALPNLPQLGLDMYGCFSVRALIRALNTRGLVEPRRAVMNALKPRVAAFAQSPCAGHITLAGMMEVASGELATAIREVIFLKCEEVLANGSAMQGRAPDRPAKRGRDRAANRRRFEAKGGAEDE